MAPRILLATTCRWFSAARIAMSLRARGCAVLAVCPVGHPIFLTATLDRAYVYRPFSPLRSFRTAILESNADFAIPCDDLAMRHLHRLYETTENQDGKVSTQLRGVLERSLGDPAGYGAAESRDRFMSLVNELGIRAPETQTVWSENELDQWLSRFGFPAVLKADGTSGGEGVLIARNREEALNAYRRLRAPVPTLVVVKRTILDRDSTGVGPWLTRRKREVSVQTWISGPDANMALACWKGSILASISVEVLRTWKPKGPATIVRKIQNAEMMNAAEKIVRRVGFSGLCGLDFLLDKESGAAYLIEMNPRATQTCTLALGMGNDLLSALCSAVSGDPCPEQTVDISNDTIALFPLAWDGDTKEDVFRNAYHDIPLDEPHLTRTGLDQRQRQSHEKLKRLAVRLRLHEPSDAHERKPEPGTYDVLHLIGSNVVGGPEKQILHHAEDMQGSAYRIAIGSFHDGEDWPEVLTAAEQRNISTVCLPGGVRPDLVSRLARVLRERPGTLLCTHGFKSNVVGYLAARRTNTLHVGFLRGFTAENRRVRFYESLERMALSRAQRVVCVSQKQAEEIGRIRGNRRPPFVVKNAMLPPYSRPHDGEPVSRKSLNIPEDAFVFGSVGRLSPEKGHRFMVSAFQRLLEMATVGRRLHLIVVGSGVELAPMKGQAEELGISDRVYFAGSQGNPGEWMRLFDCMVQPSLTEGTPNAVLEAMCMRVPVIATAVGGVPDLIADGRNGLLVPPADVDALADAMRRVMDSEELRARLIDGDERLISEYTPAHQRQKLIAVYEDAFRLQP